jgi:dethiobiotin synthetase
MKHKRFNLNLPQTNGIFITGTDTGVGKTLIAGAIAQILSDDGLKAGVFKPIATGCHNKSEHLISSDAQFLAGCTKMQLPLETINPIRYKTPAAPVVCAEHEKRPINFKDIVEPFKFISKESDLVIVEGIGGVRVPLTEDIDLLALAAEFNMPIVIVARAVLGTLNHTLLTIDAVRNAGLEIAGVIISGMNPKTEDIAEKTTEETIIKCAKIDVMAVVPFDNQADTEKNKPSKLAYFALEDIPWHGIAVK